MMFIVWLFCAVGAGTLANQKNRNGFAWLLLGFMFGIFAVIAILLLPELPRKAIKVNDDKNL
ncbi:hypothetical protein [Acinetobacter sp.]|uniref:hypothetical protein n=1 Tax=Acinetobacter sp. TaxID=472 RepID=UPI003D08F09B